MPFVLAGDLRLHYLEHGGSRDTLVFLHGYAGMATMWQPVLDRLPPDARALAFDMRGSGGSDRPATGYTLAAMTADLSAATQALSLPPFVLVGHSMGGAVGIRYALERPDRLRGLVLVNPAPADGRLHEDPALLADAAAAMARDERLLRAFCDAITERDVGSDVVEAAYEHGASMSEAYLRECVESMAAFQAASRLGSLAVPVLVVAGDRDRQVPLEHTLRTFGSIPGAHLQVFQRVGHAPQVEVTDAFVEVLLDFLAHSALPAPDPA